MNEEMSKRLAELWRKLQWESHKRLQKLPVGTERRSIRRIREAVRLAVLAGRIYRKEKLAYVHAQGKKRG